MRCTLCPHVCDALRDETSGAGLCGMPSVPVLARAALHFWEEPPISGTNGSGAVFFSGCVLRCAFCQNESISRGGVGEQVTERRLNEIFRQLIAQGAHNINLVTPTQYTHVLGRVLEEKPPVPVVWNTGGYERVETLKRLEGKVDIYLPDFKYPDEEASLRYSGASDYPEAAKAAICEMVRQTGPCILEDGLLKRGVLIRHLLLPGRVNEAKEVMDWVAETFPPNTVLFSLMSQYMPWGQLEGCPELARRLRPSEVRAAEEYMAVLGLAGYTQGQEAAEREYIPDFDLTGVKTQETM